MTPHANAGRSTVSRHPHVGALGCFPDARVAACPSPLCALRLRGRSLAQEGTQEAAHAPSKVLDPAQIGGVLNSWLLSFKKTMLDPTGATLSSFFSGAATGPAPAVQAHSAKEAREGDVLIASSPRKIRRASGEFCSRLGSEDSDSCEVSLSPHDRAESGGVTAPTIFSNAALRAAAAAVASSGTAATTAAGGAPRPETGTAACTTVAPRTEVRGAESTLNPKDHKLDAPHEREKAQARRRAEEEEYFDPLLFIKSLPPLPVRHFERVRRQRTQPRAAAAIKASRLLPCGWHGQTPTCCCASPNLAFRDPVRCG